MLGFVVGDRMWLGDRHGGLWRATGVGERQRAANWRPLGTLDGVSYEFVSLEVPPGSHRIESTEPCGIVSIGYDTDVGFGYPGGSGLQSISVPPPPPAG